MSEEEKLDLTDIEVLNVNKELITQEKHNGFKIKQDKLLMVLKSLPSNMYKLAIILLAALTESIPNFISKIPGINVLASALVSAAKVYATDETFKAIFERFIAPLYNVSAGTSEYQSVWFEYTYPDEPKYKYITFPIKSIAMFAMEHPGLVLAGGAALIGVVVKLISAVVKKVKFNKMNKKQQEVYLLLKKILKKSRKIKESDNGKTLVNDLNITYTIINYLGDYVDMLDTIQDILLRLQSAVDNKDEIEYERCRLDLETSVFTFDREHDNLLNKKMHLIENPVEEKKNESVAITQK